MCKKTLASALAGLLVTFLWTPTTQAQCAFNAPGKAKGLKSSMVRAMSPCPGVTHVAPNTSSGTAGTPACEPVTLPSAYTFGPKGFCKLKMTQRLENPCSDGSGTACSGGEIRVKCSDVLDPVTGQPTSTSGWQLNGVTRFTSDDPSHGDMTSVDLPRQWAFSQAKNGKLSLKARLFEFPLGPFFCPFCGPCTSVELLALRIVDPEGNRFATLGSSTR
jgi:hypothetical protein